MRSILFLALVGCNIAPSDTATPDDATSCTPWRSQEIVTCDETGSFPLTLSPGEFPPIVERCVALPDATYECITSDGDGWGQMIRVVDAPGGSDVVEAIITCRAGAYEWSVTRHGCS